MVGHKRTGRSPAGNSIEDRRFHFKVAFIIEDIADTFDDFRTFDKCVADFGVYNEIHIALTITDFLVLEAVPFFRQRFQGLRKEFELFTRMDGSPIWVVKTSPSTPTISPMSRSLTTL